MDLIPAIDLMNGKCVRLFKGDFNKRKDFTKEPHEQAKYWESEGAKYIHIVDLDAAKTGSPTNDKSCLLYTSPSPRDKRQSRMPSSA